jgi:hypothetical protein
MRHLTSMIFSFMRCVTWHSVAYVHPEAQTGGTDLTVEDLGASWEGTHTEKGRRPQVSESIGLGSKDQHTFMPSQVDFTDPIPTQALVSSSSVTEAAEVLSCHYGLDEKLPDRPVCWRLGPQGGIIGRL